MTGSFPSAICDIKQFSMISEPSVVQTGNDIRNMMGGAAVNLIPSTTLRNDYPQIAALAKASGEPIFITNKGEADLVVLSMEAFEEREKALEHRASILEAEFSRLAGAPTFSVDEVRARLEEKYANG